MAELPVANIVVADCPLAVSVCQLMGWTGRAPERSPKGLNSKHKEPSHEGKR